MPRVPREVSRGQQVERALAPVQSHQATVFNQAFCPVCLIQHSRGHWERMIGAEITALGIVMESRGRGSLQALEHFGPDEDRDGLYGLVKTNLLRAVAAWVSLGWLTPEEVEAAGGAVDAVPAAGGGPSVVPMPATPGPGAPSAPAPVAIPSFALPDKPGRQGAQKLIRHLKHLEGLDPEAPEVAQELERLGEAFQGWVDQVEEKINDEEAKDDPNDDRVDRLTDQKETLERVVSALGDDKDIETARGALDDAFPGR